MIQNASETNINFNKEIVIIMNSQNELHDDLYVIYI